MTKARTIADLGTGFVNISDTGTEGTKVASGTTAQRGVQLLVKLDLILRLILLNIMMVQLLNLLTVHQQLQVLMTQKLIVKLEEIKSLVITGTNFQSGATVNFIGNEELLLMHDQQL